jgi:hypothetical protein
VITCNGIEIDRMQCVITHRNRSRWFRSPRIELDESILFKSLTYLILGGGVSRAQLFWHIYGNDPEGGPIAGPQIFSIRFYQWAEQGIFRHLDLQLRTQRISGVSFYELVPTYHVEAKHARA